MLNNASKAPHQKITKILFYVSLVKNFRRQWNLDRITVTKFLKYFRSSRCRMWRNTFMIEKFFVLAEYFEQKTDCSRCRRKISQSRRNPSWWNQSNLPLLIKQMAREQSVTQTQNVTWKVLSISLKL